MKSRLRNRHLGVVPAPGQGNSTSFAAHVRDETDAIELPTVADESEDYFRVIDLVPDERFAVQTPTRAIVPKMVEAQVRGGIVRAVRVDDGLYATEWEGMEMLSNLGHNAEMPNWIAPLLDKQGIPMSESLATIAANSGVDTDAAALAERFPVKIDYTKNGTVYEFSDATDPYATPGSMRVRHGMVTIYAVSPVTRETETVYFGTLANAAQSDFTEGERLEYLAEARKRLAVYHARH